MNKLILTLSLIYGVMPFGRLSGQTNIFDYLLMYIVPTVYITCYLLANISSYAVYELISCDSVCRLGNILFMHNGCFLYLSIQVINLCRRKRFFITFQKSLNEIDENLRKCEMVGGKNVSAQNKRKKRYVFYFTWFVVTVAFGFSMVFDIKELVYYYHKTFPILFMLSHFPYTAASVVLGQFMYFVSEISQRFQELNKLFERINRESETRHAPVMVFDIETDSEKELAKNQQLRKRRFTDSLALPPEESDESGDDANNFRFSQTLLDEEPTSETNLPALFKLHDDILTLSVLTNAEYGLQCVPYMAVCFVITIFGIFLQAKVFFVAGGQSRLLDYVVFLYLLWSLSTMFVAYLVLRLCCNANAYSKQSAMIVHEIMQKKPAFMLGNDVYYNKMKSFTLQFLHWEGYFRFNGIGLFTLDYTFIFSTVSAATSYLIVLLQFDMSSILKSEGLL